MDRNTKIAICGRMASGKTTLAQFIEEQHDGKILSLAGPVKHIGTWLFGMEKKDRPLLQQIGMKMREIRKDVWLDFLVRDAEEKILNGESVVIVDDVRFVNEAQTLKENGWMLIKLDISRELQIARLQKTYPSDWEIHANRFQDPSEAEVDMIPEDVFDLVIQAENSDEVFHQFSEIFIGQGSKATNEPSLR